ncbi:MAG: AIR synthase-related protein, partial [Planctomycetota bacterium]
MTVYTVTVAEREGLPGSGDASVLSALEELKLTGSQQARRQITAARDDVYFLRVPDDTPRETIERFAEEFLVGDPSRHGVVQEGVTFPPRPRHEACIVVQRKPGVMDPVSASVLHALADAGVAAAKAEVRTAHRHRIGSGLKGPTFSRDVLQALAHGYLANTVVDACTLFLAGQEESLPDPFRGSDPASTDRKEVPIRGLDDEALIAISHDGGLSLLLQEMQAIQAHFEELGRNPTDVELESLAQTWSEHCCHKTLTDPIDFDGDKIGNLLKETVFAATKEIDADWCWSVFVDNAGVIAIDDEWGLTIKVETHNHPSALEPYGGAGTGIGGVIRDTLGTGKGALPVLNTDVFCFGPLDATADQLPTGSLHPRRLLRGVVDGVRDYGNRMGIPTANGAIYFHPGYIGNPLVFAGSVGIIPRDKVDKEVHPGDLIVAIGGRTGRDGIHGATFSSRELTEESETVSSGAVQIGNPIEEKKVLDALLRARDEDLYHAVTDCGAGGFSSAVGEMGEKVGARVELHRAPLKYAGLTPCEIWISEAQERMVLSVPPQNRERLFAILEEEEVEGCVLGEFTGDGMLRLQYQDTLVGELSMAFLHDGRPRLERVAKKPDPVPYAEPDYQGATVEDVLLAHLDHPNVASKEPVIRQYDHEVQGRMVLRPLTGPKGDAPNDACAFSPRRDDAHTVTVGCGMQPLLGEIDAYQMGAQSVDER